MTSSDALDLLTPAALREWLQSKKPGEFIGYEGKECDCPLAAYFAETLGAVVRVGNHFDLSTFAVSGGELVDLPKWARKLAELVDEGAASECSSSGAGGTALYRPTARGCLALLESIPDMDRRKDP